MLLGEPRFVPRSEVFRRHPERAGKVRFEGLWVSGSLAGLERRAVAVVGTRAPSEAAGRRSRALGEALGTAGVCVISGLALGIDGAAHAGAVDAGAPTIGVLGGGHRHFFPARNRRLAEAMLAGGGAVLSPFPPGEPARPWQFLQRNGVVAALADAVVIVEAAERSGALNTASWAANLGIDVLAFPGDVERPKAAGCNGLIRDGATLVRGAADVLEALGLVPVQATNAPARRPARDRLSAMLLERLAAGPCELDELVIRLQAEPGAILAALIALEIEGTVTSEGAAFTLGRARPA